jgi:nucleotide-binding universal stress UspA family protein
MKRDVILFCYDGSDEAKRSMESAAELLSTRDAVVVDVGSFLTGAESLAALSPGVDVPTLEQLNRDGALERAQDGVDYARRFGFDATARQMLADPPWEGILEVADDLDASVIVVGSRGFKGAKELIEHSFSRALTEHASRPVLLVPPAEA